MSRRGETNESPTSAHPSETPRTDEVLKAAERRWILDNDTWNGIAAFARTLEREAADLHRERQQLSHERDGMLEKLIAMTAERDALQRRLDAPCEEADAIIAELIAKYPQVDGKTPPLYYMELAECFGQLNGDLHRRLVEAQEQRERFADNAGDKEEVRAFQCKQCGLEVALADEERDLHRRRAKDAGGGNG